MQVVSIPLGSSGASVALSVSGGNAVVSIVVPAKVEVDALLNAVSKALPAALQPLVAPLQAAIDAELSQA